MPWVLLAIAIVIEVVATAMLPKAQGFTHLGWSSFVVVGYGLCTWLLAVVVRDLSVSVAYAVWSGAGTALVATIAMVWLDEPMTLTKVFFLTLIVVGVVGLNLTTSSH